MAGAHLCSSPDELSDKTREFDSDASSSRTSHDYQRSAAFNPPLPPISASAILPINSDVSSSFGGSSVPRDENPFSFRHFLSRCPAASQTIEQQHHQQQQQPRASSEDGEDWRIYGARPKTNTRTLRLHSTENEVKTPCGLPDFVTDHLGIEHELSHAAHPNSYYLPESNSSRSQLQGSVDSPLDLPRSSSPIHAAGAMPIPLDLANLASNVVVHSEDEARLGPLDLANLNACSGPVDLQPREDGPDAGHVHEINNNENVNSLSQLPDFLSDGPMGRMNQEPIEDAEPQLLLPAREINQVQQENERLRQQLENTMARERTALLRVERLELLLESQRRRDSELQLEKAKGQETANMRRLHQAEQQAAQLTADNRRLQERLNCLEDLLGQKQHGDCSTTDVVVDKSSSSSSSQVCRLTAQELREAASNGEKSIRDLLPFFDHLRLMAASLESAAASKGE